MQYFILQTCLGEANHNSSKSLFRAGKFVCNSHGEFSNFDSGLRRWWERQIWRGHDEDSTKFIQGVHLPNESKLKTAEDERGLEHVQ